MRIRRSSAQEPPKIPGAPQLRVNVAVVANGVESDVSKLTFECIDGRSPWVRIYCKAQEVLAVRITSDGSVVLRRSPPRSHAERMLSIGSVDLLNKLEELVPEGPLNLTGRRFDCH